MSMPENDLVPSISPANAGRDSASRLSRLTPELMNISPMSGGTPGSGNQQRSVEELLRQREWLHSQKNQLQAQIEVMQSESSRNIDTLSGSQLNKLYEQLKEDLLQKTAVCDSRELILKGECLSKATLAILQCDIESQCDPELLNRKRELETILEEYTARASQVAKEHKENAQLKQTLDSIKKENFELLKRSRELYSKIGEKRKAKEEELKTLTTDSKGKSIHEMMESKLQRNFIQNNTFQGLILGSGINWAQDEQLCKLMLDAGKSSHV